MLQSHWRHDSFANQSEFGSPRWGFSKFNFWIAVSLDGQLLRRWFTGVFLLLCTLGLSTNQLLASNPSEFPVASALKTQPSDPTDPPHEIGTIYRKTKNGWEDSSKWRFEINSGVAVEPVLFEKIHPVIWGLGVLGTVLIVLLAAQEEDEFEALFQDLDRYLQRF